MLPLDPEIAGCERVMVAVDQAHPCPWSEQIAFAVAQARVSEACRDKERLIPRVLELAPTTPAGALAKARVVAGLFGNSRGRLAEAVRALVEDLVRALGQPGPGA